MAYNRFRVQIAWRIALLGLTGGVAVWLALHGDFPITASLLGMWTIIQLLLLFRFLERTERDIARFFESVAYDAFDVTVTPPQSPLASRLQIAFARIIEDFRRVRAQREEHYQYLQTVLRHVGTGLMAFDESGRVDLCNYAVLRMIDLAELTHLNQLAPYGNALVETLRSLGSDERRTIQTESHEGPMALALHAAHFRRNGKLCTLVSLQNISQELEEKEMEAWQSILRAMTHEIRNSMTPIGSLASTTLHMLDAPQQLSEDPSAADDARLALRTIERRSQSLLRFVDAFRTLAHLPVPVKKTIRVIELMEHLQAFFQAQFQQKNVHAEFFVNPLDLAVHADPALLEQVLINLILNAVEALEQQTERHLVVAAEQDDRERVHMRVTDNGPGIPDDVKDKAFIPFFSTKPTGSVMGLSLSRLILRLHGASIRVASTPNVETTFEIVFPANPT